MTSPISPHPVKGGARNELPAYVANGVVGLRVREIPLAAGLTLISGYAGEHPQRKIEAIAVAPYPIAGDIQLGGVWLSDALYAVNVIDQAYDFATGELTSRFEFEAGGCKARIEVVTFCSRDAPSLVCQEMTIELEADSDLTLKAVIGARPVDGRALRHLRGRVKLVSNEKPHEQKRMRSKRAPNVALSAFKLNLAECALFRDSQHRRSQRRVHGRGRSRRQRVALVPGG